MRCAFRRTREPRGDAYEEAVSLPPTGEGSLLLNLGIRGPNGSHWGEARGSVSKQMPPEGKLEDGSLHGARKEEVSHH